ncbi:uncharacterized protein LOC126893646 isoform X2 [Daktulosphaira vitifoliae]|uniref:uncharacterized protein LOC126893646 isoform X2 n=1 Tax=Daktulosphaira vitifoliae TaxID=58002 RepID=UPI0021AA71A7|nr:uncharacterized protein LOC126893646 isoform X2 [Daktulosphaira vitifoliae]
MFEKAYKPTRLGNWEVPKWHLNRPKGRSTVTKIIVNDKGHLLPGVQKVDQKHWAGLYLGTYQLPKRITREIAEELTNPKTMKSYMKRSYHQPIIDRHKKEVENKCYSDDDFIDKGKTTNEEEDKESIKSSKTVNSSVSRKTSSSNKSRHKTEQLNSTLPNNHVLPRAQSSPSLSHISIGQNRNITDQYEFDNKKHHRLPDTIEDALYRSLQMKRDKHPGLGLNDFWPKCSAVAYKSFNDPGPTQCSKLKVFRPKSSSDVKHKNQQNSRDDRPKTSVPLVCGRPITDIKLALCWDLDAPFDRPQSVDKPAVFQKILRKEAAENQMNKPLESNFSAIMGLIKEKPSDLKKLEKESNNNIQQMKGKNLSAVMDLIPKKQILTSNNEFAVDQTPIMTDDKAGQTLLKISSPNINIGKKFKEETAVSTIPQLFSHQKEAVDKQELDQISERGDIENKISGDDKKHYRPCVACDLQPVKQQPKFQEQINKYKMAFKAGIPQPLMSQQHKLTKKHLKVPRPKTTNSDKKKYVIGTLLPPFSMWPGTTGRDYPEHWRLTSVYRQAFKPLESRKQPFLQTIYL